MKLEYLSMNDVNHWAQMSCTRWNKKRGCFGKVSRKWHRGKYLHAVERSCASPRHQIEVSRYQGGDYERDTYPWPYREPMFANWPESDDAKDYSLISDQSGFVVKSAASYVAYKIYELTGKWPEWAVRRHYDVWGWLDFLDQAGYCKISFEPKPNRHYVGILNDNLKNRSIYEWGLVVWAEKIPGDGGPIKASTYENKVHRMLDVNVEEFTWVEIPTPVTT